MKDGERKRRPDDALKARLALAAAEGPEAYSRQIATRNQTPNLVKLTDHHMEIVMNRVAAGEMPRSVCADLGVSSALVRQRIQDQRDLYGGRYAMARAMNADECFEMILEVSRDTTRPAADKKLEMEALREIARVYNRQFYGDKIQHDHRAVVVNISKDDDDLG